MRRFKASAAKQRYWIVALLLAGFVMHGGTAVLRVDTFLPYPRLVDFSGFYTAAWAVRSGLNPYDLSAEWVADLQLAQRLPFHPPPIYNPVIWAWLLQPFTLFAFPAAAWFWVILNMLLLAFSIWGLLRLMGEDSWSGRLGVAVLVVTFGPVVLDLSIGQTSVFLLAGAVVMGISFSAASACSKFGLLLAQGLTTGVKLYPLTWLASFVLHRRWRSLWFAGVGVVLVLALSFLVLPEANVDYWLRALPQRLSAATGSAALDDQSLMAWVQRVSLTQQYQVPGLRAEERVTVTWTPPWRLDPVWVSVFSYGVLALLCGAVMVVLFRAQPRDEVGGFYLWVVYALLAFPHIERYNHTLLLPAMAWLWGYVPRSRWVVAAVYFLVGVSRLTHLWMVVLPPFLGTVVSGAGVYAVVLLGAAMMVQIRRASGREVSDSLSLDARL